VWHVWVYFVLLIIFLGAGMVLAVFTLPGLWLMTAAAAGYALITHEKYLGWHTLVVLLVLALLAEILEFALTGAAAKKAGGGFRAAAGGIIGAIIGGIFLSFIPIPIVGTVLGICLGSFLGAAGVELLAGRETAGSLKIGWGAAKGRFMGIVTKVTIGVVMGVIILWRAFP
jgi:uncharacterized protein